MEKTEYIVPTISCKLKGRLKLKGKLPSDLCYENSTPLSNDEEISRHPAFKGGVFKDSDQSISKNNFQEVKPPKNLESNEEVSDNSDPAKPAILSNEDESENFDILQVIDSNWKGIGSIGLIIGSNSGITETMTAGDGFCNKLSLSEGTQIKLHNNENEGWIGEFIDLEYPENPGPLPSLTLKDKSKSGQGPLQMGDAREDLIRHLQMMLLFLDYDIGQSGPDDNGVDGKFGSLTQNAVRKFQEEHTDYSGQKLKVDGLVGEKTSDSLNRMLVGIWYNSYETPPDLTPGVNVIAVTKEYAIKSGIKIK